jgi:3-hydroxyisobutyrate dehydrogenase-like beta-hydroxyacid dehydrogenase
LRNRHFLLSLLGLVHLSFGPPQQFPVMPKKTRTNVGLIGLGIIGSRVANSLRTEGFPVYVWNRTPRAAPRFMASPKEVAKLCDVIQIFVADAQALFEVLDAMSEALTPNHVVLCNATVGPEATIEASRMVIGKGAQFLDAPFTGSKTAAENRELVYYIGGDDKTLELVKPVLEASSKAIVKIGKIGDAAVVKVATNMISAVTVQTLSEAYAIVKGSGIDPNALSEALKFNANRSGITDLKLPNILNRNYEPHFSLKHMFKDVQLGIHIANALEIDLPATTSTAGVMYGGLTRGWGDLDFSVLGRLYQKDSEPAALAAPTKPAAEALTDKPVVESEPKMIARESTPDELRNMGIPIPEADDLEKVPVEVGAKSSSPGDPLKNTAPGSSEGEETPFVRLRKWLGTSGGAH